jgi:hypothetical protein
VEVKAFASFADHVGSEESQSLALCERSVVFCLALVVLTLLARVFGLFDVHGARSFVVSNVHQSAELFISYVVFSGRVVCLVTVGRCK